MKKVGKTARPFRYDLNQIPYDFTVEVGNRFNGLDLIEYLINYGWRFVTLYRRQGSRPIKLMSYKIYSSDLKEMEEGNKMYYATICGPGSVSF